MSVRHLSGEQGNGSLPAFAPVVIIGGGIVGISSAYFLRRLGIFSIVLEADSGIGLRTTAMSAHALRAQFSEPDNILMMAESLAFYEEFGVHCQIENIQPEISLCQQGYLFASTSSEDSPAFSERVAQQLAAGLDDVDLLRGDEIRQRFPWLSSEIKVGTFRARDGWIDSARAVSGMATAAESPIHLNVTVEEILVDGHNVVGVRTNHGTIATDTVVLAAGPFSRRLSPEPLPLTLWRRHRVIVSPHPDIPQSGPMIVDANTGAHWRPHLGGALAAWAQPAVDGEAVWPVPTDSEFVPLILNSANGIGRLSPFWRDLAPRLPQKSILLTAGQYTNTPDHRPLIGKAVQTGGLFLHTGYSGHGIMGSPAGARILAEVIANGSSDQNPFDPSRFEGVVGTADVERVVI